MYGLAKFAPRWRTSDVQSGYVSEWDGDWSYHFHIGGYKSIQWVEIAVDTDEQRDAVLQELVRIHVPAERTTSGYRVFGYAEIGQTVDYIAQETSRHENDAITK